MEKKSIFKEIKIKPLSQSYIDQIDELKKGTEELRAWRLKMTKFNEKIGGQ